MSGEHPFDEFAKNRFSNFEPEVPARIWDNIVAEKNRKPKGFWITWFTGTNLLVVIGVLLIASLGIYKVIDEDSPTSITKALPVSNSAQQKGQDLLASDKTNQTTSNSANNLATDPSEKASNSAVTQPGTKTSVPSAEGQHNAEANSDLALVNNSDQPDKNTPGKKRFTSGRTFVSAQGSIAERAVTNDEDAGNTTLTVKEKQARQREDFQQAMKRMLDINIDNKIANAPKLKLPDCPTIEKDAAGNKKYLEAYVGPDYTFSNYKTFGDTAGLNYAQKRKETTSRGSAYSAGVRFTKVFNNAMSVKAGVNYSQINEKFNYVNPAELRFITVITTRVIIRAPGDTLYINDTLRYQQSGTRVKTTYNKYRSIDIPLMLGYELGNGKVHANISAGAIINLYSWYKGDVLDSLYQPVSINSGKSSSAYQYKTNIGVGFISSVSVYYKLNDQWHLLLEPYFRYNLSPMSKENLNIQQRYHTAGIRAGIRFDLGQRK